jgi:hypothetical protein
MVLGVSYIRWKRLIRMFAIIFKYFRCFYKCFIHLFVTVASRRFKNRPKVTHEMHVENDRDTGDV